MFSKTQHAVVSCLFVVPTLFWAERAGAQCRGSQEQTTAQQAALTAARSPLVAVQRQPQVALAAALQRQQLIALQQQQQIALRNALQRQQRSSARRQQQLQNSQVTSAQVETQIRQLIEQLETPEPQGEQRTSSRSSGLASVQPRPRTQRQIDQLETLLERLDNRRVTPAQANAQLTRFRAHLARQPSR